MKKFAVILSIITIAATLLLVAISILHPEFSASPMVNGYYISSNNYDDRGNLTAAEKLEAARLAAYSEADDELLESLKAQKFEVNKSIGDVSTNGQYFDGFFPDRTEGYVNSSVKMVYVPIHVDAVNTINPGYKLCFDQIVLVDVAGKKVLGWGQYPCGWAVSITRTVPPCDYWFMPLTSGYGLSGRISLEYTPTDAESSLMVLDKENFDLFSSGAANYTTDEMMYFPNDYSTMGNISSVEQISSQGTYRGASAWSKEIRISALQADGSFLPHRELYYIVLHNEDQSREIKVKYSFM